jgi:hypothetical protein
MREIILNKGGERYIFRYQAGQEDELLDVVCDLARSGRTEFDWFDAAVISFKLTQMLIAKAKTILEE